MTTIGIADTAELITALANPAILPGDILELENGTYTGDFSSTIAGTDIAPIIVRPVHPGSVIIDGTLTVGGTWTHWYDINFTDSNTDRYDYVGNLGIYTTKIGTHIHGCLITDIHASAVQVFGARHGEVSECVIYNNGYHEPDDSGHGHGLYSHNDPGGNIIIARNIFGDQFGAYAFQIYSGGANHLLDYDVYDNVICGNPVHTGGGLGLINFTFERNIQFQDYQQHGRYSPAGTNDNGLIHNNYFIGMTSYYVNPDWSNLTEADNEVYGGEPSSRAGYTTYAQPATKIWLKAFTESARWLGMVTIFNRDSAATVSVDLSSILANGNYRLRNGQNMTETWDFTQLSSAINVPMNIWTASHVVGEGDGENHLPVFGSFVIESGDNPIYGDTTWGHKTGVTESNIRSYAVNWTGTGGISGINDAEKIGLHAGDYMISEVVNTGVRTIELLQNNYDPAGDDVNLDYRHGATEVDCLAAAWNDYSVPFVSLGFVQIRLTSTL
jgi:hypothetical protein